MESSRNSNLERLAEFIGIRNEIEKEISRIIERPSEKGHISEYIASQIFPITLNEDAATKGYDATFIDGDLKGKKVDVKYYSVNQEVLDLKTEIDPDIYLLVFTGPREPASSSRGKVRPFRIDKIYLFNERDLVEQLRSKVKVGVATSVKYEYWEENEIYPKNKWTIDLKLNTKGLELLVEKINR